MARNTAFLPELREASFSVAMAAALLRRHVRCAQAKCEGRERREEVCSSVQQWRKRGARNACAMYSVLADARHVKDVRCDSVLEKVYRLIGGGVTRVMREKRTAQPMMMRHARKA
jgi:hypothetical protein